MIIQHLKKQNYSQCENVDRPYEDLINFAEKMGTSSVNIEKEKLTKAHICPVVNIANYSN